MKVLNILNLKIRRKLLFELTSAQQKLYNSITPEDISYLWLYGLPQDVIFLQKLINFYGNMFRINRTLI